MRSPPASHRLYVVETAGWTVKVLASEVARAAFDGLRSLSHKPAKKASRWGPAEPAKPCAFNAKGDRLNLWVGVRVATAEEAADYIAKHGVVVRTNSRLAKQAAAVQAVSA